MGLGWFDCTEPPLSTYLRVLFNMGSSWFDSTEPPLSTYLEEKQGVQGDFALVRWGWRRERGERGHDYDIMYITVPA